MAEMIPDRLPRRSSAGEQRVFQALQKLDDDCLVYYEPLIRQRYPDFIVVLPDTGVLVIEVKGWHPAEVIRGDTHEVLVRTRGVESVEKHPARQARDYMHGLRDACREHLFGATLLNASGPRAGAFVFPFGHIAVLSNITRAQVNDPERAGLAAVFSQGNVVTRDELAGWEGLDAAALKSELARRFDPFWRIDRMTQQRVDLLRSVIHPEVVVPPKKNTSTDPPSVTDLKVLDYRQERNARSIGEGHRIIYGVAGSGKTLLLIARAKMLAEDLENRILVLCFNRVLANYLKGALSGTPNVEVFHFHAWGATNGVRFRRDEEPEDYGARLLQILERGEGDAGRYDAVFVDEAQDLPCSWFTCAKMALSEPEDGDLVIVGDGSQSLYKSRPFTWLDAGIHARGRVLNKRFDLDRNYRNTAEILAAAYTFAGAVTPDADDAAKRIMPVKPEIALRHGPWPKIIEATDRDAEADAVVALVREWIVGGAIEPDASPMIADDIGILYPRLHGRAERAAMERLCGLLAGFGFVRLAGDTATGGPADKGVKISTINSARGLQFRGVIFIWADLLPSNFETRDEQIERMLMYVALTRAEDRLAVTYSGRSAYVDEILQNIAGARASDGGSQEVRGAT
jgi:hypothetical protein